MGYSLPEGLKFDSEGLIPAIVQDAASGRVLMLAYMNREALELSLSTGETHFYSRSRQELWHKGATSGHYQHIVRIFYDCDGDALLVQVRQDGVACHEGEFSCFHHPLPFQGKEEGEGQDEDLGAVLNEVFEVIKSRRDSLPENSYTARLFREGQTKILKKIGEEATEAVIASKDGRAEDIIYELADLYFHTLVLLAYHGLELKDLARELKRRRR